MQFRSEFTPKLFAEKIKITDKLLLVGSCFTEQMGTKLAAHKFDLLQNPNGILFNPISIVNAIKSYANNLLFTEADLFYYNELWASKEHHTMYSGVDKAATLAKINESQKVAFNFLQKADWLLITIGSAFVYEWVDVLNDLNYGRVVANCHKLPANKFNRRLTTAIEIADTLASMQALLIKINPALKIIYTISPVRHLREGFVENNQSKAALIQAVHSQVNERDIFYFPAYELVIDDLRDYRFFAEDMVHPNYTATNYVWQKFTTTAIDESSQLLMKKISELNTAINHKPFNPTSKAHIAFRQKYLQMALELQSQHPSVNFTADINFFS